MKRLIVNGDDFGYTQGINEGIVRAHDEGILTSATLMANGEAFDDAVKLARARPSLAVGCHLVLVGGRAVAPRSQGNGLVGSDGRLPASLTELVVRLAGAGLTAAALEGELRAQVARICEAGIEPTHLDTHKHTHVHPRVMEALARVGAEFGIRAVRKPFERLRNLMGWPARSEGARALRQSAAAAASRAAGSKFERLARRHGLEWPEHFYGLAFTGLLRRKALLALFANLPEGTGELMCHPGICDAELERASTRLKRQREQELAALVDPEIRRAVQRYAIELINYRELTAAYV